ncbi:DNA-directed RNA polymerase III subunit RPC7-like [Diorhabda carinulata]|uniref:DNA-directed RNA polymerase III subunit RPC7-like n=1 Tax=Diorhabda carinulata TaxID=1163345 RepID=UPI0025A0D243|nr:DNA-directed RNA polymerase III subunit RPC7-like [Diorhabda carinulata]
MSGRGRGGRGRGGVSKTFNREQLTSLGVGSKDLIPGPVLQPPPLYPILERRPVPLTQSLEMDYLLILRQDFIDHLQLSGSYVKMIESKTQTEQAIDKLVAQMPNTKEKYDWRLFPSELRPKILGKRLAKQDKAKEVNIEQRLNVLEKLETKTEAVPVKTETVDEDEEDKDDIEGMEEDEDEEMDDGTDYANNYFDNGEGYEDEDDNLEDGPIY